jgi:lysophospholipase L1-like esterase
MATYKFVTDGDSQTASDPVPVGAGGWVKQLQLRLEAVTWGTIANFAVSGNTVAQVQARQATTFAAFDGTKTENYLWCWCGTNSLYQSVAEATCRTQIQTLCDDGQTAGFKVLVATILPRQGVSPPPGTFETSRLGINAQMRLDFDVATDDARIWLPGVGGTYADMLVDVDADTRLHDITNPLYSYDETHLTSRGQAIVRDLVYGALMTITGNGAGSSPGYVAPVPRTLSRRLNR